MNPSYELLPCLMKITHKIMKSNFLYSSPFCFNSSSSTTKFRWGQRRLQPALGPIDIQVLPTFFHLVFTDSSLLRMTGKKKCSPRLTSPLYRNTVYTPLRTLHRRSVSVDRAIACKLASWASAFESRWRRLLPADMPVDMPSVWTEKSAPMGRQIVLNGLVRRLRGDGDTPDKMSDGLGLMLLSKRWRCPAVVLRTTEMMQSRNLVVRTL
ncbi:hypothetical protein KC318_g35 [Hortaea werneckii]|nr:hypothetical protein KC334_g32 [Hortaea werneckii]KAI7028356.1 hypothetical protein KC355_g35 [Hortaea werneckii]KAI7676812.1 hypothetical protein KC318_g35 [Hortaea werneckii]